MTIEAARLRPLDIGKPRMRGWLHTYAFFVAAVCGVVLTTLAATQAGRPGVAPWLSCAIYSLTVCGLFGTSALYHRRVWSPRGYKLMRRLDHSMIFVFIAGTYTPFSVLLLPHTKAIIILAVVWGGAVLGVVTKLVSPNAPRWASAPLYIALGWVAVFVLTDILHIAGVASLVLLAVGGVLYTVGGVAYAIKKPNPWPGVFGYHEVFHAMTILAAICHYIAVYFAMYNSPFVG